MEVNTFKFKWPPINDMGEVVKEYIESGQPLSIADDSGIYKELEEGFAKILNRKYALVLSSGTMGIYSAFFALDLLPGDEIISTAYSYHATAAPALHLGLKIVFCDVESDTGNIDCDKIEELITEKTKAIITNDQWGHPCDKDRVLEICKKHNLKYIEDCSHAHFSQYKGKYTGTFGDIACFSLQGNKLLSGGEGGIIVTDNQELFERAVLLGHNLKRPAKSVKNEKYKPLFRTGYGLKLRIHPLAAVMVNHQLKNYVFDWIKSREETLNYFQNRLSETFLSPMVKRDYVTSMGAWYGFKPFINKKEFKVDREDFSKWMNERGFEVDIPGSELLPDYAIFKDRDFLINGFQKNEKNSEFPNAVKYFTSVLSIPTFTFHEYDVIDKYIDAIKEYEMEKRKSEDSRNK